MKKHTLLIGAHISIAGGLEKSVERAQQVGCTCMQIFTKSNKQWSAKPILTEEATLFIKTLANSNLESVIAHASYLINLGSSDVTLNKKSIDSLILEVNRCHELGIKYLVLHPGAAINSSEQDCLERIADNLTSILEQTPSSCTILLENTAGQGSAVCYTLDQLAIVREKAKYKNRIGFCIDTCHAFVAGYDLRTSHGYENFWQEFDNILGIQYLKAIHVNDSKKGLGSYVDRHEHIGKGTLGLEPFRLLMNDERFFDIPKIIETPKDNPIEDDMRNIETLKSLLSATTIKKLNLR
jgi:deoxyribonuclease-4